MKLTFYFLMTFLLVIYVKNLRSNRLKLNKYKKDSKKQLKRKKGEK